MRMKNFRSYRWVILIIFALFAAGSAGCSSIVWDNDLEMKDFILGTWRSVEVYSSDGNLVNLEYQIKFRNERVMFTTIYPGGGAEGSRSAYNFLDDETIFVDNKRIVGGETWLLEKRDGYLIVTRNFDNKTTIIILERRWGPP